MKSRNNQFIIAEIGVNHNGSMSMAKKLINYAAKKKIDAVKFQFFKASKLVTSDSGLAPYQRSQSTNKDQLSMLKKYELSLDKHLILKKYCHAKKIEYMTSFFDIDSIKYHKILNLKRIKVPSGELTNIPYLQKIAQINKQILLSTGMANMNDIKIAINTILKINPNHKKNLVLMQCTSEYPAPINRVNLSVLKFYKDLGFKIGFSDHTVGHESAIIACALGAEYIEKHITLDNKLIGPDHKASLNIKNFSIFLEQIHRTNIILGSPIKALTKIEKKNSNYVKKKIITNCSIKKGEYFSNINLTTKRSKYGTESKFWLKIIGKKAKKNYKKGDYV